MEEIKDIVLKNSFEIKDIEVFALNIPLKKSIKMSGITIQNCPKYFYKNNLK